MWAEEVCLPSFERLYKFVKCQPRDTRDSRGTSRRTNKYLRYALPSFEPHRLGYPLIASLPRHHESSRHSNFTTVFSTYAESSKRRSGCFLNRILTVHSNFRTEFLPQPPLFLRCTFQMDRKPSWPTTLKLWYASQLRLVICITACKYNRQSNLRLISDPLNCPDFTLLP